ncbi:immunoglobulin superfamily member 1-like [Pleurodeles waltl]|uniref:immunoglobulin superfamily member 1-like n=1 Tax=Pleurodeles waltl TaxID=8319 RepID=UPI0037095DFF
MWPVFTSNLFFSCFFLDRWSLVSLQKPFPKPSLRITSGSVTVRGGNLTLTCTGSRTDVVFALYRGERSFPAQEPPGTEAVFHFTDVNTGHEGRYHCLYYSKGTLRIQSEPSNSVEVTLRDSYPKPLVKLIPGSVVRQGGSLTIHCTTEYHDMRFILFRKGRLHRQEGPPGNEAVFVISGIQQADEGPYQCRYHSQSGPVVWSEASDDFQIRVLDLPRPSISYVAVQGVEGDYRFNCSAPQNMTVRRFFLYKDGAQAPLTDRTSLSGSYGVTFPISGENARAGTEYRCSYQILRSGEYVTSQLSDPIQIEKDFTQGNIVQIVLAAVVLLIILVILTEHLHSNKRDGNRTRTKHYQND